MRRRTSPQRRQTAWIGAEAPRLGFRRVRTVGKVRTAGEVRDPGVETSRRRRRSQRRAQRSGRVGLVEDRAVFAEPDETYMIGLPVSLRRCQDPLISL